MSHSVISACTDKYCESSWWTSTWPLGQLGPYIDAASDMWCGRSMPICLGIDLPKYAYSDISEGIYADSIHLRSQFRNYLFQTFAPLTRRYTGRLGTPTPDIRIIRVCKEQRDIRGGYLSMPPQHSIPIGSVHVPLWAFAI